MPERMFLYWEATALACDRVVCAHREGDTATVELGSLALPHWSGEARRCCTTARRSTPPVMTPACALRWLQSAIFSGDMSRDFLAMMDARARMAAAIEQAGDGYSDALAAPSQADDYWHHHHAEVVMSLHPGSSLLREKLARLRRERESFDPAHYIATVVHSEEALAACDDYFGVARIQDMRIGDYWTQAIEKLATPS